jgi:hypothetical protein
MIPAYLYLNALLYAAFAAWCTFSATATARAVGYLQLNAGGESEYRVVYGGLQLGLAAVFALLARRSELWENGLIFSLAIYLPLVAYRLATIGAFWPVPRVTLAVAAMETLLLAGAIVLWFLSH